MKQYRPEQHIEQIRKSYRELIRVARPQYQFTIEGRVIPYVRMTRRGKWTNPRAQAYLASQDAIRRQFISQMVANDWKMLSEKTPLKFEATLLLAEGLYKADVDNYGKALMDAAQGIVFRNDVWIIESRITKTMGMDNLAYIFISEC